MLGLGGRGLSSWAPSKCTLNSTVYLLRNYLAFRLLATVDCYFLIVTYIVVLLPEQAYRCRLQTERARNAVKRLHIVW